MKTIELGEKSSHDPGMAVSPPPEEKNEIWYPCLYVNVDGLQDLPESGEAVIKFRRKSLTIKEDGKPPSAEIEVHSITPIKSKEEDSDDEDDASEVERALRESEED